MASGTASSFADGFHRATDSMFGTRAYTPGALYQVPRKIPVRIEPKTYFALERTFLAWMHMAVTLGGVMTALVGFTYTDEDDPDSPYRGAVTRRTSELITLVLLPLSILMVCYALFVYHFRSKFLKKKQYGFFDDKVGPVTLCVLIMVALSAILIMAIVDYVHG